MATSMNFWKTNKDNFSEVTLLLHVVVQLLQSHSYSWEYTKTQTLTAYGPHCGFLCQSQGKGAKSSNCKVMVMCVPVIACFLAMTELRSILGSSIIISVFTFQSHRKKYTDRVYQLIL